MSAIVVALVGALGPALAAMFGFFGNKGEQNQRALLDQELALLGRLEEGSKAYVALDEIIYLRIERLNDLEASRYTLHIFKLAVVTAGLTVGLFITSRVLQPTYSALSEQLELPTLIFFAVCIGSLIASVVGAAFDSSRAKQRRRNRQIKDVQTLRSLTGVSAGSPTPALRAPLRDAAPSDPV